MKKCTLTLVVVFTFLASQASAQITDPDQRMRWFNLQRLAIETREIEACQFLNPSEQRYTDAYYRAAGEMAAAIEAYISKYPDGRGKQETPDAYRYRVWSVALRVGIEKARSGKQMNVSACQIMVFSRQ
jgi:hypothetical protein